MNASSSSIHLQAVRALSIRQAMTSRLIILTLAIAAFGWAFSEVVERSNQSGGISDPGFACNSMAGNNCDPQFVR
jgi:hypothetical protein